MTQQPRFGRRYGRPPLPPRRHRLWPWILFGVVILAIGGCFAVVGVAGKEAGQAVDSAVSSLETSPPTAPRIPNELTTSPPATTESPLGQGKNVVYEITSDVPALTSVTYFDEKAERREETGATAPWTRTVLYKATFTTIGVGARTEGGSVTCRITVDGKVKDEQTATGAHATVNCTTSS
ncbi:MmpS family transport accessory protein [Nocardia thailandica]|uniref:MmpS family transport accessory protein n=1 Tax=Nocardia thailandica TaxID=257275 RepID=A0ABW6PY31_9NOCA